MSLMRQSLYAPYTENGAVFVVIVVPVQSLPITTSVVSSNPAQSEAYWIKHYVIMFVSDFQQVDFLPVSSPNKADGQDMATILLKVALNTITLNPKHGKYSFSFFQI